MLLFHWICPNNFIILQRTSTLSSLSKSFLDLFDLIDVTIVLTMICFFKMEARVVALWTFFVLTLSHSYNDHETFKGWDFWLWTIQYSTFLFVTLIYMSVKIIFQHDKLKYHDWHNKREGSKQAHITKQSDFWNAYYK